MQWNIGEYIFYDENECILTNNETKDAILLPATASRLLSFLVNHHGIILTRDEILSNVWDKYGYRASNNTLTQYMSIIRKDFLLLGETSEIIVTIPKIGFILKKEIIVKSVTNHDNSSAMNDKINNHQDYRCDDENVQQCELIEIPEELNNLQPAQLSCVDLTDDNGLSKKISLILTCMSAVILLTSAYIYISRNNTSLIEAELEQIGYIDNCPVFMFYRGSFNTKKIKLEIASSLSKKYLPCIKENDFYIQPDDNLIYGEKSGRVFISRCAHQSHSNSKYSGCKNVLYYN